MRASILQEPASANQQINEGHEERLSLFRFPHIPYAGLDLGLQESKALVLFSIVIVILPTCKSFLSIRSGMNLTISFIKPVFTHTIVDTNGVLAALEIEKRAKFSRRRGFNDDADIDYINERNMRFNKKAERFYGKYTAEIKQNLERGTAV
ncbi:pre-mRNA-splicing factor syf2 [Branchiostoma belcheri]|nr:pre-mRNA-splicing factor syf2 [Branchiostoma belcheri]